MSELKRVPVWSAALRGAHWTMAASVLVLLASGWLLVPGRGSAQPLRQIAQDLHVPAGEILAAVLALRLGLLLFGRAADGWRDLIPQRAQVEGIKAMLRFYLSGGRAPLPGYYGHNPLWAPLYAALLAVLVLQTLSGLWMEIGSLHTWVDPANARVVSFHRAAAPLVLAFALAHLLAVVLHDWRGGRWEISAMVNGQKIFEIQRPTRGPKVGAKPVQIVRLDEIAGRTTRPPPRS